MIINPIKESREEKGLTQANLALLLDITQIYISQFETGGLVSSKNRIKKIAEIWALMKKHLIKSFPSSIRQKRKS